MSFAKVLIGTPDFFVPYGIERATVHFFYIIERVIRGFKPPLFAVIWVRAAKSVLFRFDFDVFFAVFLFYFVLFPARKHGIALAVHAQTERFADLHIALFVRQRAGLQRGAKQAYSVLYPRRFENIQR